MGGQDIAFFRMIKSKSQNGEIVHRWREKEISERDKTVQLTRDDDSKSDIFFQNTISESSSTSNASPHKRP